MTTYGAVIGTGAYTLLDGSTIRTPATGLWNVKGYNLENYGVPADVYMDNTAEDFLGVVTRNWKKRPKSFSSRSTAKKE